MAATGIVNNSK